MILISLRESDPGLLSPSLAWIDKAYSEYPCTYIHAEVRTYTFRR